MSEATPVANDVLQAFDDHCNCPGSAMEELRSSHDAVPSAHARATKAQVAVADDR